MLHSWFIFIYNGMVLFFPSFEGWMKVETEVETLSVR